MTNQTENLEKSHILQVFETDLNSLHNQLIDMINLVMSQLDQSIIALNEGDRQLAEKVISADFNINQLEMTIDAEVLTLLAKNSPVANDLRIVLSTSKIADELEKIGNEISFFSKMIIVLYDPKTSDPNEQLLIDIIKIANLVKQTLKQLQILITTNNAENVNVIIQSSRNCEAELEDGIKHLLNFVVTDARLIGRALDMMNIMKSLELCGEYCRNIAKYVFFMIEGLSLPEQC
jgi:phosphate transport system protein